MKVAHEESGAGEGWLISYCDMISLLVTFFLMMMTFSSTHFGDTAGVAVGMLRGRGGIFPNLSGYRPKAPPSEKSLAEVATKIAAISTVAPDVSIGLVPHPEGVSLVFDRRAGFAPGSSELSELLRTQLALVGEALHGYTSMIVVEGFADAETDASSPANALSTSRALAAARVLHESARLPSASLQFAGFGAERPRSRASTDESYALNRRVEIRLTALDVRRIDDRARRTEVR